MSVLLSITCSRADAPRLSVLLRHLEPAFAAFGGQLLEPQGPPSGFLDPATQVMAEIHVFSFSDRASAEAALACDGFTKTAALREEFSLLDVKIGAQG